mgnify:CR=1 FL=1
MAIKKDPTDLSIKGESIQTLYGIYLNKQFLVNRRYQRKLVWSLEEKKSFINSIINGYPVPLILLAEVKTHNERVLEIIDGMQRLNALMSFINQEFDIEGKYFDLDTMADSKLLKDAGELKQKEGILDRKICADIARYQIPLSIYQESEEKHIDEIFRRLNSGGKHLSKQELRQAGVLTDFASLVRKLSSNIRGDSSASQILDLNSMKNISITNKSLEYGINIEDIFWVKNNIITKDDLRQSKDEEIIADIIAWTVSDKGIRSSSDILDELYGFGIDLEDSTINQNIETNIKKINDDIISNNIQYVFDTIINVLEDSGKNFNNLFFQNQQSKISRYFQIVFYSFYELLINRNLKIGNIKALVKTLDKSGDKVITLSAGGGNWSAKEKQTQMDAFVGVINKHFIESEQNDPARNQWITKFENILMQSSTEQTLYDFKVGFHNLDDKKEFNQESFNKVIKTLTAMANTQKKATGYCIIGVSDKESTSMQYEKLYGVKPIKYSNFDITGINGDSTNYKKGTDEYFTKIHNLIKNQPISDIDKDNILRNISLIKYFDKEIIILKMESGNTPSIYDGQYFVRHGSNIDLVEPVNFGDLFSRFQ